MPAPATLLAETAHRSGRLQGVTCLRFSVELELKRLHASIKIVKTGRHSIALGDDCMAAYLGSVEIDNWTPSSDDSRTMKLSILQRIVIFTSQARRPRSTSARATLATRNGPVVRSCHRRHQFEKRSFVTPHGWKIFNRPGEQASNPPLRRGRVACGTRFQRRFRSYLVTQVASAWVVNMGSNNSHEDAQRGAAA